MQHIQHKIKRWGGAITPPVAGGLKVVSIHIFLLLLVLLLSLSYPKIIKDFAATANHNCLLLTREALPPEVEHHRVLEAMSLLRRSRAQSRLELLHAPVTQSRAAAVHEELAHLT